MDTNGPTGYSKLDQCNCPRCQYEAGKISLSPTTQTCYMVIVLVVFVYLLFWIIR